MTNPRPVPTLTNGIATEAPLGPADRLRAEPLTASGFQRDVDVTANPIVGTQPVSPALLNWTLPVPAVLRVQFVDPADAATIGFDGFVVVSTGVDGGVTTVRYRLQSWGVAIQVPAGATTVAIQTVASGLLPGAALRKMNFTISPGCLRERHVLTTITELDAGTTIQPPAFAVRATLNGVFGGGGNSSFSTPDMSFLAFLSAAQQTVVIEANPIFFGIAYAQANIAVDWTVYE